jgi:CheY-like chemotaxis protein
MDISTDPDDDLVFDDDDALVFKDESVVESAVEASPAWILLMVDDDDQVHQSTVLALGDELVLGRKLSFIHAKSGREAIAMIGASRAPDIAFVDMVMESADAGLRFAQAVKADPEWREVKILLRSGQPGFSNEMEQARAIGVEGFAQKASVSRAILIQALSDLLSGKSYFMA